MCDGSLTPLLIPLAVEYNDVVAVEGAPDRFGWPYGFIPLIILQRRLYATLLGF